MLPGGLLAAMGLGLSLVPATIAAVSGVSAKESGLASGMLNTSRLIGGALGLAVLSTIAASRTRADLLPAPPAPSALSGGFRLAFAVAAALSVLGARGCGGAAAPAPLGACGVHRRVHAIASAGQADSPESGSSQCSDAGVPV